MVLEVKVGTFLKPSTGAPFTHDITGLGFQPQAIIFWTANQASDSVFNSQYAFGLGFADANTNEQCVATFSDDNAPNMDTGIARRTDAIMACITSGATAWRASVTSLGPDGFTLTFHVNDGRSVYINYIAFGGDDFTGAFVGQTSLNTSTGNQTITNASMGFTPNFVMMFTTNHTSNDTTSADAPWGFGCATSSTARWAITLQAEDASDPSNTNRQQFTNRCLARLNTSGGSMEMEADFVSFGSNSFTINLVDAPGGADLLSYIAMRFNNAGDVLVGTFNSATATGNQTVTAATTNGNKAVLLANINHVTDATTEPHNRINIGGASALDAAQVANAQCTSWAGDTDNETTTINGTYTSESDTIMIATEAATIADSTIFGRGDVTQFGSSDYVINWAIKNATAYELLHIVFASTGGGGGGGGGGADPVALTTFVHMGEGGYY